MLVLNLPGSPVWTWTYFLKAADRNVGGLTAQDVVMLLIAKIVIPMILPVAFTTRKSACCSALVQLANRTKNIGQNTTDGTNVEFNHQKSRDLNTPQLPQVIETLCLSNHHSDVFAPGQVLCYYYPQKHKTFHPLPGQYLMTSWLIISLVFLVFRITLLPWHSDTKSCTSIL